MRLPCTGPRACGGSWGLNSCACRVHAVCVFPALRRQEPLGSSLCARCLSPHAVLCKRLGHTQQPRHPLLLWLFTEARPEHQHGPCSTQHPAAVVVRSRLPQAQTQPMLLSAGGAADAHTPRGPPARPPGRRRSVGRFPLHAHTPGCLSGVCRLTDARTWGNLLFVRESRHVGGCSCHRYPLYTHTHTYIHTHTILCLFERVGALLRGLDAG